MDIFEIIKNKQSRIKIDHQSTMQDLVIERSRVVLFDNAIIRFGDKYKQWNAAFDAGFCAALDKPYITLHNDDIIHPLKEVDAAAMAWAQTPAQVVELLKYTLTGR